MKICGCLPTWSYCWIYCPVGFWVQLLINGIFSKMNVFLNSMTSKYCNNGMFLSIWSWNWNRAWCNYRMKIGDYYWNIFVKWGALRLDNSLEYRKLGYAFQYSHISWIWLYRQSLILWFIEKYQLVDWLDWDCLGFL